MSSGLKDKLIPLDPEVERTLRELRKNKKKVGNSSQERELELEERLFLEETMADNTNGNNRDRNGDNNEGVNQNLGHGKKSIRELTQFDDNFEPLVGATPTFASDFEIKGSLVHSLPKFHGLAGENPYTHLSSLHMHCMTMKPVGAKIEDVMWKVFHLTLEGKAKDWYMCLPRYTQDAYQSWANLRRYFLEKYYPSNKAAAARKDITSARQEFGETFYEYWTRFQDLIARCPITKFHLNILFNIFVMACYLKMQTCLLLLPMDLLKIWLRMTHGI